MGKIAWFILAWFIWMAILPTTAIIGWAFMISGPFAVIVGIINFIFNLCGVKLNFVKTPIVNNPLLELIFILIIGIALFVLGKISWGLAKTAFNWLYSF